MLQKAITSTGGSSGRVTTLLDRNVVLNSSIPYNTGIKYDDNFIFIFVINTSLGNAAYTAIAYNDEGVFTILSDGIKDGSNAGIFLNENNEICIRNNPAWYSSYPNYRVLVQGLA